MTMLLLVRHGETVCGSVRRFIGQVDPPLGEPGRRQADRAGRALSGVALSGIFCSDLQRARRTAECIGRFHPGGVTPLPVLREIDLGAWDGMPMDRIKASDPQGWADRGKDFGGFRPPGGESFGDLQQRVVPALTALVARADGNLLVVTHAGVIRVFLCHILGRPLQNLFEVRVDYGAINRIDCMGGDWRLKGVSLSPEVFRRSLHASSGSNGSA